MFILTKYLGHGYDQRVSRQKQKIQRDNFPSGTILFCRTDSRHSSTQLIIH